MTSSTLRYIAACSFALLCLLLPDLCHAAGGLGLPEGHALIFIPAVTLGILAVTIEVLHYFRWSAADTRAQQRQARIAWLKGEQQKLRSSGNASEQHIAALLHAAARELDAQGAPGMILRYAQPSAGRMPSCEVDCLLVTSFAVVLVEVKHWKHPVELLPSGWHVAKEGRLEPVRSPLAQSAPKQAALQQLIASIPGAAQLPVHSIAVLSHPNSRFPADAPLTVLYPPDLRYWLRTIFHAATHEGTLSPALVQRVDVVIVQQSEAAPDAKHRFLLQLAEAGIGAGEYQALEEQVQALRATVPEQVKPAWKLVRAYLPAVVALGLLLYVELYNRAAPGPAPAPSTAAPVSPTPVTAAKPSAATKDKQQNKQGRAAPVSTPTQAGAAR